MTLRFDLNVLAFFEIHLLKKQELEIIGAGCMGFENHRVSTLIQEASNDPSCFIYRLVNHPDVVIVQCKVNISPEQLFLFTEQVSLETGKYL